MTSWYRDSGELGAPGLMGTCWGGEEDADEEDEHGDSEDDEDEDVTVVERLEAVVDSLVMFAMDTSAIGWLWWKREN